MSTFFGGTTVGLKARDGIVLASDKRMSYGGFIVSRKMRKIFLIDKAGVAFSGLYGDIGGLIRILENEIRYYRLRANTEPKIYAIAKLLSNIMYAYKLLPFYVEVIVAGLEDGEPKLYVLDPLGSILEEDYAALGSGAATALGVLEEGYENGISLERAEDLAVRALRSAMIRDASSGDGIDLITIAKSGVREKTIRFRVVESG